MLRAALAELIIERESSLDKVLVDRGGVADDLVPDSLGLAFYPDGCGGVAWRDGR